jgi:hypothetical protein
MGPDLQNPLTVNYINLQEQIPTHYEAPHVVAPDPNLLSSLPDYDKLFRYLARIVAEPCVLSANTKVLLCDKRPMTEVSYWPQAARFFQQRAQITAKEVWMPIFVPITEDTGLHTVHYCWGKAFIAEALVHFVPNKHILVLDHDCVPTSAFEIEDLVALAASITQATKFPSMIGMADCMTTKCWMRHLPGRPFSYAYTGSGCCPSSNENRTA